MINEVRYWISVLLFAALAFCVIDTFEAQQRPKPPAWWDLPATQTITVKDVSGGACWITKGEQHAHIEGDMTWQRCAEMALKAFEKRPLP